MDTEDIRAIWPDSIHAAACDSTNRGVLGLVTIEAGEDVLRLAFKPAEVRQLVGMLMNLVDAVDDLERQTQ